MKSRLFPPGCVALVVNSQLLTPHALAACAQACKPVPLRRRAACCSTPAGCVCACRRTLLRRRAAGCPHSLLRSWLRSCQTKKSIDFIWYVRTWDWYELQVQFMEPERYTDAHLDRSYGTDEHVLQIIEQHLQKLAGRRLDSGDALHIRV